MMKALISKFDSKVRHSGFTLLEMMVSLAIFSIISAISYTSLINFFQQSDKIEAAHSQLESVQKLFALLEQDIRYIIARPVFYNNTIYAAMEIYKNRPVFPGEKMQFTTSRPIALKERLQTSFRVSWRLVDNSVYRYSWEELDLGARILSERNDELQHVQRIINEIEIFKISFALPDSQGIFSEDEYFNEQNFKNDFDEDLYKLPRLVKIDLITVSGRNYHRIFEVLSLAEY